jgi:hypothetical protein
VRGGIIHGEQTSRWACVSILIWQRSDLILAEMSHQVGFRLEAVARNTHAALRCNITIGQNRGNASAREPRTCHGRGFSLLDAGFSPGAGSLVVPVDGPALISQSRRKILPAKIIRQLEARQRPTSVALRPMSNARPIAACRSAAVHRVGAFFRCVSPAVKSQRRRQTLLSMTRLEAAWETER